MSAAVIALALVASALGGAYLGRHLLRVSLAAWCMAHPSATLVMRAALDLDDHHAEVRGTVEAALATGEPLFVVASSVHDAEMFRREHATGLDPNRVRFVTDPAHVRGLNVGLHLRTLRADDHPHAAAIAQAVACQVHKTHAPGLAVT